MPQPPPTSDGHSERRQAFACPFVYLPAGSLRTFCFKAAPRKGKAPNDRSEDAHLCLVRLGSPGHSGPGSNFNTRELSKDQVARRHTNEFTNFKSKSVPVKPCQNVRDFFK